MMGGNEVLDWLGTSVIRKVRLGEWDINQREGTCIIDYKA
jgi:hypothetical protein